MRIVAPAYMGRKIVVGIDSIIIMLIVGAIAGWLAGQIVRGFGFGQSHPALLHKIRQIGGSFTQAYESHRLIVGLRFPSHRFGVGLAEGFGAGEDMVGDFGEPPQDRARVTDVAIVHFKLILSTCSSLPRPAVLRV